MLTVYLTLSDNFMPGGLGITFFVHSYFHFCVVVFLSFFSQRSYRIRIFIKQIWRTDETWKDSTTPDQRWSGSHDNKNSTPDSSRAGAPHSHFQCHTLDTFFIYLFIYLVYSFYRCGDTYSSVGDTVSIYKTAPKLRSLLIGKDDEINGLNWLIFSSTRNAGTTCHIACK